MPKTEPKVINFRDLANTVNARIKKYLAERLSEYDADNNNNNFLLH